MGWVDSTPGGRDAAVRAGGGGGGQLTMALSRFITVQSHPVWLLWVLSRAHNSDWNRSFSRARREFRPCKKIMFIDSQSSSHLNIFISEPMVPIQCNK